MVKKVKMLSSVICCLVAFSFLLSLSGCGMMFSKRFDDPKVSLSSADNNCVNRCKNDRNVCNRDDKTGSFGLFIYDLHGSVCYNQYEECLNGCVGTVK